MSWLPVIGRTPDATSAIVEAGDRAAESGEILSRALEDIPGGLTALVPRNGTIPIEPLEQLAEPLERAGVLLAEGQVAMEDAPTGLVLGPVASAQEEFGPLVEEAARSSRIAAELAGELPTFLGGEETKRYFLAPQNPAEMRGTGGFIGAFTIMTVREGEIQLGEFRSVQFLSNAEPGEVPPPNPDYGKLYGEFEASTFWSNINMTPDFPSAATAIERLYKHLTGEAIDGVVVVDPFALADLMAVGGPVEVPGIGVEITPENAVEYLTNHAYADLPESDRKEVLGEAAKEVIERFLAGGVSGGRIDAPEGGTAEKVAEKTGTSVEKGGTPKAETPGATPEPTPSDEKPGGKGGGGDGGGGGLSSPFQLAAAARALVETAAEGHVLAHSTDAPVQRAFQEAGISGQLASAGDGDLLAVIGNNAAGNKTDFYVDRRVTYTVQLDDGGAGSGYATVALENDAPAEGEPRTVIGPHDEQFEAGQNVTFLSTYCATTCAITGISEDGQAGAARLAEELGHPVATSTVDLPSGDSTLLEFSWDIERAWDDAEEGVYRLNYIGQPTIRPTRLRVEVLAPPGASIAEASPGMEIDGDRAVWEGNAASRMALEVRFDTSLLGRIVRFLQSPVG